MNIFIFIVWVQFICHKTEKYWFWKSLKYFNIFDIKKMISDLNMSHGLMEMSNFVSFPLFGLSLVIKLRNFDFESHWNTLLFFFLKQKWCQIWMSCQFLIWFKLCCVSIIWVISLEMQILNLIEIVNIFELQNLLWDQDLSQWFLSCLYLLE